MCVAKFMYHVRTLNIDFFCIFYRIGLYSADLSCAKLELFCVFFRTFQLLYSVCIV